MFLYLLVLAVATLLVHLITLFSKNPESQNDPSCCVIYLPFRYSRRRDCRIIRELDEISARLPGRLSYTWGKYDSDEGRNKGYTHALVTDFADEAAQEAFLKDPVRMEFSKREVLPRMPNGVDSLVSFGFLLG